jgi:hypothetical protein
MTKQMILILGLLALFSFGCSSNTTDPTDGDIDGNQETDVDADSDPVIDGDADQTDGDTDPTDGDIIDGDADEIADGDVETDVEDDGDTDPEAEAEVWDYMEPWESPSETWTHCEDTPLTGSLSLHEKAAYYDWIVPKLHQVPATEPGHETYSRVFKANCDADVPAEIVPDDQLPYCTFSLSENNGLWTSLYVASQAFRYAATGDAEALAQLKRTLNGTYQMLLITGKSGLYTRDFRDPSLAQQYCIEDEEPYASAATDNERYARYTPPTDRMVGNQFLKVDTDGCFMDWDVTLNDGAGGWHKYTDKCTDTRFAGFCWQRNVSKDEYAGHMLAAGIVAKIVDDPEVHAIAVDILQKVGQHLVDHGYWINDFDGRGTRYGSANAMSLDSFTGANAMLALTWTKMGAVVANDAVLHDAYDNCLLQKDGRGKCIVDQPFETGADYRTYLDNMGYMLGCNSNYDTISIGELAYFNLVWYEQDLELRNLYRTRFTENTKGPDNSGRNLWDEANPFFNMMLVSRMDPQNYDAAEVVGLIDAAVCSLKRFNTDNIRRARDCSVYEEWCVSQRHGSLAEHPIPVEERCQSVFEWWGDPNQREVCGENLKVAEPPAGYLLPYWMGRYFGYIDAEL